MIPNLNELPILLPEKRPWKKLLRPLLAFFFLLAGAGGVIWLYTTGLRKVVDETLTITAGLQAIGEDLWTHGQAPEIRLIPPDLKGELNRLRPRVGAGLRLLVLTAGEGGLSIAGSHQLIYMQDTRKILTILVATDAAEGKVDILSWETAPEFTGDGPPRRR
jgi:hypothetical protein